MNHFELQELLWDWHDGELPASQTTIVRNHYAACAACQDLLEDWKKTAHMALTPLQPSDAAFFTQNVMRNVRLAEEAEERPRFFARWAFPAFALSLSSFAAVFLYVAQPTSTALEGSYFSDSQTSPSEWINTIAKDDPILGSVVEKP